MYTSEVNDMCRVAYTSMLCAQQGVQIVSHGRGEYHLACFLSRYASYCWVMQLYDCLSYLSHNPLYLFCSPCLWSLYVWIHSVTISSIVFLSLCFFFFVHLPIWTSSWHHHQQHRMPTQMQTLLILMHSGALLGQQVVSPPHPKPHSIPQIQVEQVLFQDDSLNNYVHTRIENVHIGWTQTFLPFNCSLNSAWQTFPCMQCPLIQFQKTYSMCNRWFHHITFE